MSVQDLKLEVIQVILGINDLGAIERIKKIADKASLKKKSTPDKKETYLEPKGIPFEVWNRQFNDSEKQRDFVQEYGLTLHDFRYSIWKAEQTNEIPYEQFKEELNTMKNELQSKYFYKNQLFTF